MGQNLTVTATLENEFDPSAMLAVIRKLSGILAKEVELLKQMKITEIHIFYNEKIELSARIEGYKEILSANPELLNSIPPKILYAIQTEAAVFEGLVKEDQAQIVRAKEVHKLVMEAVRVTLQKNRAKSSGYNKEGIVNTGSKGLGPTPSVSVNENF